MRTAREAARIGNIVNIVMGSWLFVSTFLWPHTAITRANTLVMGLLVVAWAVAALVQPAFSWVDALPAAWLFTGAMWLPHQHASTAWNSAAVGAVVFLASLAPVAAAPLNPMGGPPDARSA